MQNKKKRVGSKCEKNKRIERLEEIKIYDFAHKSKPVKVLQVDLKEIIDSQSLISAGWFFPKLKMHWRQNTVTFRLQARLWNDQKGPAWGSVSAHRLKQGQRFCLYVA